MTSYSTNSLPPDFNPEIYKSLHMDLVQLSEQGAVNHFITSGWREGRKYLHNQTNNLPNFIKYRLEEINFNI